MIEATDTSFDSQPGRTSADKETLRDLVKCLSLSGYAEFYASFNPLAPRLHIWQAHRPDVIEPLGPLVDLFLLAEPVAATSVAPALGETLIKLIDLGLLAVNGDGRIVTADVVLLPIFGHWLFCQKPQVNPTLYFGDDSVALLQRLRPARHGRCLDLCAGPGIQSLQCSLFAGHVTAVEINPIAAELARLNVLMNDRDGSVTVHRGDLYEPVRGQTFDTIVANPPLLPFPEEVAYPFVGHGGDDGLRVTWRILEGLPAALAEGGTAQLIGTCLSDGLLPLCSDALEAWARRAGMRALMTVTSHRPLDRDGEYFGSLVGTAAAAFGGDPAEIALACESWLRRQQATHLCAFFLHIVHGTGGLQLQDLSRDEAPGLWYV